MLIKTNEELRDLTGAWYASNDFNRIRMDIELETEELAKVVGDEVIELAQSYVSGENITDDQRKLISRVQLPIALMATYRHYQSNILGHEDSSRKVKVNNENEKVPWEWMLDRDDAAHLSKAQRAIDRLIYYLDKEEIEAWKNSPAKIAAKSLFVNNTTVFGDFYPIDNSARFYYLATSLLREIQVTRIKDALGEDYMMLLDAFQSGRMTKVQEELLDLVRRAQVLSTIALAVRRLNVKVLPDGIVKTLKSEGQTSNASRPANVDEISYFSRRMDLDAENFIDKIKRKRKESNPDSLKYQMLPKNDPKNKFAST